MAKNTVTHRFAEARKDKDFDQRQFCGVLIRENMENAKDAISRIGKLWAKTDSDGKAIFPKSEKAWDTIQTELYEHIENMVAQLKAGNKKIVKDLVPVEL